MIIFSTLFLLLSNAVFLRRDKSILFNIVAIIVLLYSSYLAYFYLYLDVINRGIGLFGILFSQGLYVLFLILGIFICVISAVYFISIEIITSVARCVISAVYYLYIYSINILIRVPYCVISAAIYCLYIYNINILISVSHCYNIMSVLNNALLYGNVIGKNNMKKPSFKLNNIKMSSYLTITIYILILTKLLFIFIPKEWLSTANILALNFLNI